MSVQHIIADLKKSVKKQKANMQYKSHIVDFTFSTQLIADELVSAMAFYVNRRRRAYGTSVNKKELAEFRKAAVKAVNNTYTYTNVRNAHKVKGFRVFTPNATAEIRLANYSGFKTTVAGSKGAPVPGGGKPIAPKTPKLGTIVHRHLSVNAPPYSGGFQGLNRGITCTYAASMGGVNFKIKNQDPHNEVIKFLWFNAVDEHKKELIKLLGGEPNLGNPRYAMAGKVQIGSTKGKTRSVRLHGPLASKSGGGYPIPNKEDTSEKIIGIIDTLKDLTPRTHMKLPKNVTNYSSYQLAHKEVLEELDAEFSVNGESLSDIVTIGKIIRIKMSQGGQQHQIHMKHADKDNVDIVLKRIETDLLSSKTGLADKDYRTSAPVSKLSEKAVLAQVVKYFVTKSGKPDMRYKVNKQAALKGGQREKETSKGSFNIGAAGALKTLKTQRGKRGTKSNNIRTSKETSTRDNNPIALKELINQALPEAMLLKMQPPALRNRTGRFRQSAEVTNVTIGPRGGTDIDYTYMRDPYEVFEPGGKMGSRNRDPRKLIGGTIREIATQITGNKFITTRRQ